MTRGEEAHVSERSELCAAPSAREERREPAGAARPIASRPILSLGYFSLHEQREVTRSCEAGANALLSSFRLMVGSGSAYRFGTDLQGMHSKGRSRIKGFRSPSGRELLFFARAKKR